MKPHLLLVTNSARVLMFLTTESGMFLNIVQANILSCVYLLCLVAHAQTKYTVVCLCVCLCRLLQLLKKVQVRVSVGF